MGLRFFAPLSVALLAAPCTKDGRTSYPRGWRRDQHAAKCALARATGADGAAALPAVDSDELKQQERWVGFPCGQYHGKPSITLRFCELGLDLHLSFWKECIRHFWPKHLVTRWPAAASLVLHTVIGPAPEYVTEAGSTPLATQWTRHSMSRYVEQDRVFEVSECFGCIWHALGQWQPSLCLVAVLLLNILDLAPLEDIHLFKEVIDQLMACVMTFFFTCCRIFSQFIDLQAMHSNATSAVQRM